MDKLLSYFFIQDRSEAERMAYSEDQYNALSKWLLKNYPTEAAFISEITKNVNDILQHLNSPTIGVSEDRHLTFKITKKPETDYLELKMDLPTMLFMGGMGNAIAKVVVETLLPNLQLEIKKCSKCNSNCPKIANYCLICGNKFES
jgi:hypothetical protein